jgi:hypothetical protein
MVYTDYKISPQKCLHHLRIQSYEQSRRVLGHQFTDVSEESSASIFGIRHKFTATSVSETTKNYYNATIKRSLSSASDYSLTDQWIESRHYADTENNKLNIVVSLVADIQHPKKYPAVAEFQCSDDYTYGASGSIQENPTSVFMTYSQSTRHHITDAETSIVNASRTSDLTMIFRSQLHTSENRNFSYV